MFLFCLFCGFLGLGDGLGLVVVFKLRLDWLLECGVCGLIEKLFCGLVGFWLVGVGFCFGLLECFLSRGVVFM